MGCGYKGLRAHSLGSHVSRVVGVSAFLMQYLQQLLDIKRRSTRTHSRTYRERSYNPEHNNPLTHSLITQHELYVHTTLSSLIEAVAGCSREQERCACASSLASQLPSSRSPQPFIHPCLYQAMNTKTSRLHIRN